MASKELGHNIRIIATRSAREGLIRFATDGGQTVAKDASDLDLLIAVYDASHIGGASKMGKDAFEWHLEFTYLIRQLQAHADVQKAALAERIAAAAKRDK